MLDNIITIVIPTVLTLAAGMGGAMMLSTNPEQHRSARSAFYLAGVCLWVLGVSIGLHSEGLLLMRIGVAALIGAFAAGSCVYAVSLTHAQDAKTQITSTDDSKKPSDATNQNNSSAPNFSVPGSNNTFNYNSPPSPPIAQRDPDGLYQLGELVATVSGAHVDVGNSLVSFQIIRSSGKLDSNREVEYRDYVIQCPQVAGAPPPNVQVGTFIGMTAGAQCKLIRKR